MQNKEYRSMTQPLTFSSGTDKRIDSEYYVEGYATTFDKPYLLFEDDGVQYFEKIDRHALDQADMSDVLMLYNHDGKPAARTTNGTLGLEVDNIGLLSFADLSKSRAAKELHEEIKNGLITKMSWAFVVADDSYDRNTHTRTIFKIKKVYDVSAVSMPANNDTSISARSYVDGILEMENKAKQERRIRLLELKLKLEE